jgi:phosphoenolpyruvate-protein phosphotransferase/dihydroxyacetone kinase phosphotransfer subunit
VTCKSGGVVGLVIVSHSAKLAEGVAEMARAMAGPTVRLAATGGLALPDHPLGTDAVLILQAIEQVYSDEGVVVLMDLGSAVLSAEMAIEQLTPERRAHVFLSEAPLVEGALAAAVQAKLGNSVAQVLAEARSALSSKGIGPQAETNATEGQASGPSSPPGNTPIVELRLTVHNRLGLHARPAARIVQTAGWFGQADVQLLNLTTGRGPVNAKSINGVATLGVRQGHEIRITASGAEAGAALTALSALAGKNFGDPPDAPGETAPAPETPVAARAEDHSPPYFQGFPASPGIAVGPARLFRAAVLEVPKQAAADPQAEWERLEQAIETTRGQIMVTRYSMARRAGDDAAGIFDAYALYLSDEALLRPARQLIFEARQNAAAAWQQAVREIADEYRALDDAYQRARAADVEGVGRQVLHILLGEVPRAADWSGPGILIAADLTPVDTAHLDAHRVRGIATAAGGPTSHSAILARTLGIPAVVCAGDALLGIDEGTPLLLDGEAGRIWPNPSPKLQAEYGRRADAGRAAQARALAARGEPAATRDGRRVEVAANIGTPADARQAVEMGAEAVGLFRTEFLFLDRRSPPDEEEQYAAYLAAAEILGQRPLVIRTLDVGGDKPLPYVEMEPEANPFLGQRAIRLSLARPEFFKVQLRAIARAAAEHPIRVMFPMIALLSEFRAARALLMEARDEIAKRGQRAPERIKTGIMVEIPAAALRAQQFALEVDFFSVGTNDLTQYTLAAERGNPQLAGLADAMQPAVLQLIGQTVVAAHVYGKWVGVCGELAGEPQAVPMLVGLGVDELSMNALAIPRAKEIVRALDYGEARAQAEAALALETPVAVRAAFKTLSSSAPDGSD